MAKYKQAHVRIISEEHRKKYTGNISNIFLRSGWEQDFFHYLMNHKQVVQVTSEEVVIPYTSPIDGKRHRYYMDFEFTIINNKSVTKKYLVEVKPFTQTQAPKQPKDINKKGAKFQYRKKWKTYLINMAKWEHAINWAYEYGYEFMLLTDTPNSSKKYTLWKWNDLLDSSKLNVYK